MLIRYVLDGPPGAGKTTLLFGESDTHKKANRIIKPNLSFLGFKCIRESAASTHFELKKEGINPIENFEFYIGKIVEKEREKYLSSNETKEIYFFDRCFHHWVHFRGTMKVKLPGWYDSFNNQIRYSNPIFILAPILSLDLTQPKENERTKRFTVQERIDSYNRTKDIYEKLGYCVVEIPVYNDGNIKENNRKRIEQILKEIYK